MVESYFPQKGDINPTLFSLLLIGAEGKDVFIFDPS
jgi:hypothetical protein